MAKDGAKRIPGPEAGSWSTEGAIRRSVLADRVSSVGLLPLLAGGMVFAIGFAPGVPPSFVEIGAALLLLGMATTFVSLKSTEWIHSGFKLGKWVEFKPVNLVGDGPLQESGLKLQAIDHVLIAMPEDGEPAARRFYRGLLGLTEVPKTGVQAQRGGCWFEGRGIKVHLGVDEDFRASKKAHVAFLVDDVSGLRERAKRARYETKSDDDLEGYERVFIFDPFGNRLEFLKPLTDQ